MSGDGMAGFITELTSAQGGLTSTNLWTEATNAAPLIALVAIFAFGYRIIRKVTSGASKGKVRM